MKNLIDEYYELIDSYVSKKISADVFKEAYTQKYLNDDSSFGDDLFDILDRVFAEADLYTRDNYLLENFDFYLSENQLFEGAKKALDQLRLLK